MDEMNVQNTVKFKEESEASNRRFGLERVTRVTRDEPRHCNTETLNKKSLEECQSKRRAGKPTTIGLFEHCIMRGETEARSREDRERATKTTLGSSKRGKETHVEL